MNLRMNFCALLMASTIVSKADAAGTKNESAPKAIAGEKTADESTKGETPSKLSQKDIGVGVGILAFAPPAFGFELAYTYRTKYTLAMETGSFTLTLPESKIQSKFGAIHLRYALAEGMPFFLGLGYAQQSESITSATSINVDLLDEATGISTTSTENINWTVGLKQALIIPHIGWMWMWESGAALTFALGAEIPLSSKLTISGNPAADSIVEADKIADSKAEKTNQVKKYLDRTLPYIAIKFNWFIDAF